MSLITYGVVLLMTAPKVLHILPDLSMGGGQVVVLRHLRVMAARGLRPMVAYCRPVRELEAQFLDSGIELVDLGYRHIRDTLRARKRLLRAIEEHGVNIVQTHGTPSDKYFGHIAALSSEVCQVTTLHGNPPHAWRSTQSGIRATVRRWKDGVIFRGDWLLNRRTVRGVVAVSDAMLGPWRPILQAGGFDQRVDIEVIYSGIPMAEFGNYDAEVIGALRQQLLGSKAGPIVLGVSRLSAGKDVDQLVEMLPQVLRDHPETILALAGDGPERSSIEERIRGLSLEQHVRLLGQRSDVPALLQASDLLVFPSKNEGFGLVALEALASALPVVCFDLPSLEKLKQQVPALQVVQEPTIQALAKRVSHLLGDVEALAKLGRQGRAVIAERWNVEDSTDAYLALYERLLSHTD
jgi:glycosyltransferase involved in cell wall biosynthesis